MVEGNYPFIKIDKTVINLTGLCSITYEQDADDVDFDVRALVFDFPDRVTKIFYSPSKHSEMEVDLEGVWNILKVEEFKQ